MTKQPQPKSATPAEPPAEAKAPALEQRSALEREIQEYRSRLVELVNENCHKVVLGGDLKQLQAQTGMGAIKYYWDKLDEQLALPDFATQLQERQQLEDQLKKLRSELEMVRRETFDATNKRAEVLNQVDAAQAALAKANRQAAAA